MLSSTVDSELVLHGAAAVADVLSLFIIVSKMYAQSCVRGWGRETYTSWTSVPAHALGLNRVHNVSTTRLHRSLASASLDAAIAGRAAFDVHCGGDSQVGGCHRVVVVVGSVVAHLCKCVKVGFGFRLRLCVVFLSASIAWSELLLIVCQKQVELSERGIEGLMRREFELKVEGKGLILYGGLREGSMGIVACDLISMMLCDCE